MQPLRAKVLVWLLIFSRTVSAIRESERTVNSSEPWKISAEALLGAGRQLRRTNWLLQKEAGLDLIPSNDFSFYDKMLDMSCLLGNVPPRFGRKPGPVDVDLMFRIA